MSDRFEVILFDFFGTLVTYEPARTEHAYPTTHALLGEWGHSVSYDHFLATWDAASAALEADSAVTHHEFSMDDAAGAFGAAAAIELTDAQRRELAAMFVTEWAYHVRPIDGVADMLERLAEQHRIGIVSNTHDAQMVPNMLGHMRVNHLIEAVVLSAEHGRCKPHPSIYRTALDCMDSDADGTAFVGDSYASDFVGPESVGMTAYLIDPSGQHEVPPSQRLQHVLDVEVSVSGRR